MVGMSAGVSTSGVVCVNGRDVCSCEDFCVWDHILQHDVQTCECTFCMYI